jgi:hypothetical protein
MGFNIDDKVFNIVNMGFIVADMAFNIDDICSLYARKDIYIAGKDFKVGVIYYNADKKTVILAI